MRVVEDAGGLESTWGGVFVPTMGALHAGHAALIERARGLAGGRAVVVSVFVNPTQFNERSDFERYPRSLESDVAACERAGADVVFAPSVEVMYPAGVKVDSPALPAVATQPGLEDAHRPGHFAGVCQVCRRLFELVRPSRAVFGEKDWQQLAVVRAMVASLGLALEIVGHPTVREADGLAMSSRNALLAPNHRRRAAALHRALTEAAEHSDANEAEAAGRRVLLANRIVPEYFVVRDAATLGDVRAGAAARALVAARVGGVRLIDNECWPGSVAV
ncbi:MAG: pantoate--beta-alanine ligase [Phycisphaerae bacterium]|nr:pantoate--beta-alanine ligase [Phycisphaerae bacterium]